MKRIAKKKYRFLICIILFEYLLLLSSCMFESLFEGGYTSHNYDLYRFSIKNDTNSELEVKLIVGEIPNPTARFNELVRIPDEIYRIKNKNLSNDTGTYRIIKTGKHGFVDTGLPLMSLGVITDDENHLLLRDALLGKLYSFVLTVSSNGEIKYRIAGWDVPEEDMIEYQINDTCIGYYDASEENYIDSYGCTHYFPIMYSKLWPDGSQSGFVSTLTCFVKVTSNSAWIQEFNPYAEYVDEAKYWLHH